MRPFDSRPEPAGRGPLAQGRQFGPTLLWVLAAAAIVLLIYEARTLVGSVLLPLIANPHALQTDFHYYYDAARRFAFDGSSVYRLSDDVIAGFTYPPPAIVPFVALAKLPLGTAFTLMTVATYVVLLVTIRQWLDYLARHGQAVDRLTAAAATVIALSLGPTYMNAVFGQVNAFVLGSSVAFVATAFRRPMVAGAALALGSWLKIYPMLLAWIASWDRRAWRALGNALAAAVMVVALSLIVVPIDAYRMFLFDVLPTRSDKTAIHITNQSLIAFLERFRYEPPMFLNWTGEQAITFSEGVRAINFGLLGIALVVLRFARARLHGVHAAAMLMALIAIVAPLGWGHMYVMALPLVVSQLIALRQASPVKALAIAACVCALMLPAGRHLPLDSAPAFLQNIVYSRYLLATIVLVWISAVSVRREPISAGIAPA
ncbi:MAG TPA: glycosyltransferase family 87 protein [Vicinamibacterales bacterium]|nr:glycosyltransferase family 87 protein [Vicinamibacterales bacterium]